MNDFIELTHQGKRVSISIGSIDLIEELADISTPKEKCRLSINGTKMVVEENYELIHAIIQKVLKK